MNVCVCVCVRERERERDFCRAANFWVSGLKKNCSEEHGFKVERIEDLGRRRGRRLEDLGRDDRQTESLHL